jgi:PD-(D/E)XK nuclease superfamily
LNPPPAMQVVGPFGEVPYISASGSERLLVCSLRYLLDREPAVRRVQPFVATALVGTAAHKALSALTDAQLRGEAEDAPVQSTRDVAVRLFDQALAKECERRDEVIADRGRLPGDATEVRIPANVTASIGAS